MTGPSTQTLTLVPGLACTPQVCLSGLGRACRGAGPGSGGLDESDSKLLCCRLPQLPLLGTVHGPGPRGRHPQRPGAHQHCVSKEAGPWGHIDLELHLGCVTLNKHFGLSGLLLKWERRLTS